MLLPMTGIPVPVKAIPNGTNILCIKPTTISGCSFRTSRRIAHIRCMVLSFPAGVAESPMQCLYAPLPQERYKMICNYFDRMLKILRIFAFCMQTSYDLSKNAFGPPPGFASDLMANKTSFSIIPAQALPIFRASTAPLIFLLLEKGDPNLLVI